MNRADIRGLKIEDLLGTLKRLGVSYYFGRINGHTDKMIREFNRVGGKGTVVEDDLRDPEKLLKMIKGQPR